MYQFLCTHLSNAKTRHIWPCSFWPLSQGFDDFMIRVHIWQKYCSYNSMGVVRSCPEQRGLLTLLLNLLHLHNAPSGKCSIRDRTRDPQPEPMSSSVRPSEVRGTLHIQPIFYKILKVCRCFMVLTFKVRNLDNIIGSVITFDSTTKWRSG